MFHAMAGLLCAVTDHNAKYSTIEDELLAHIEVLHCVECGIIGGWQGNAMPSYQGPCGGQGATAT